MNRVAVITSSDSGYAGKREDLSGPAIAERMRQEGWEVVYTTILPDERTMLAAEMIRLCDDNVADLILTTGGTGFSQRDWMPEATQDACTRMVPGIPETMRAYSMQITPRGMLSRSAAGIREKTLIINLPGSPKAVRECLDCILPAIGHAIDMLKSSGADCAAETPRA